MSSAHAYELLVYFTFILQHSPNITDINKNDVIRYSSGSGYSGRDEDGDDLQ